MKRPLIYIFLLLLAVPSLKAQRYTPQQLKAAVIYRLCKNIYWPGQQDIDTFRILFYGENQELFQQLKQLEYLKIHDKPVKVTNSFGLFQLPEPVPNCIVIDNKRNDEAENVFNAVKDLPVLVITDRYPNFDRIMINLGTSDGTITFEVNNDNLKQHGLLAAPRVLILGGELDQVRRLYQEQEQKMAKIKKEIELLQQQLEKKQQQLKQQEEYLKQQMAVIDSQKAMIDSQKQWMARQQEEIRRQRLFLQRLLDQIDQKNDSLKQTQTELSRQRSLLIQQQQQVLQSKKLYDSISAQIARQQQILEKQKFLIKLQQRGLVIMLVFLALALILAFIIYRNYRYRKRMSEILQEKNAIIKNQNEELKTQAEELRTQAEHLAQANAELEKLSLVASYTDNAVSIMQPDGRVEWVNASFINFYGRQTYDQIFEEKPRLDSFRQIPDFDTIIARITREKKSYQFIEPRQAGDRHIWIQTYITPIFNADGTLRRIIAVDTDITPTKEAEQVLRVKNKEITQSIQYASRIQGAILPQLEVIGRYLPEYFIFYKPRDIVSGDFYWIGKKMDKIIFAAADCTGHGVPGAFMSMLGTSLLNSTVNLIYERYGIEFIRPEVILNRVRRQVIKLLHQKSENLLEPKDGMDLALCVYDRKENILQYAGANNSLYLIRKKEHPRPEVPDEYIKELEAENWILYEIKADRMPVGISRKYQQPFTLKQFKIYPGDTVYIFSDGFADQFGGPDNRKFMSKNFKKLLLRVYNMSMEKQKEIIEDTFNYWLSFRSGEKHGGQTDDVLIWGVRF